MLINSDIKRIVGGGCEIKEVRYMDSVVWKKGNEYKFQLSNEQDRSINIYANNIILSYYPTLIETELSYVNLESIFRSSQEIVYMRVYVGEDLVFSNRVKGEYNTIDYDFAIQTRLDDYVLSKKNINYVRVMLS